MGRGSLQPALRARCRFFVLLSGLSAALLALPGGCGPRIKITQYSLELPRLDDLGGATGTETTLVDLHELFLSKERIVYGQKEIPRSFEEVRVLTIDGAKVPESAGYGEISPGRHVFRLAIKTTDHWITDRPQASSNPTGGKSLETRELVSQRKLTLHLRPGTLLRFDREGRHAVERLSESLFGPGGTCRRQGARDLLCRKCSREDGIANCVQKLHLDYYEAGS